MADSDYQQFERDPDWWWLQLRFAVRDGRLDDAAAAQNRLAELGIEVTLRDVRPLRREAAPCK